MIYKKVVLNEIYKNLGGTAYLECYIPDAVAGKQRKFPAMLVLSGGAYAATHNREGEHPAMKFLADGYRSFALHYSLAPSAFPQQLLDVAAAMELIYENAEEWLIDTDKVAILGFSAGGHLAAQYTNRYNIPEIRQVFPESKPVQACLLGYAVLSGAPGIRHEQTICNFVGHSDPADNELGCSCDKCVTEQTPPTFLWHTQADQGVSVENALLYAQALREKKVPFELHIYPFGGHALSTGDSNAFPSPLPQRSQRVGKWVNDSKEFLQIFGF